MDFLAFFSRVRANNWCAQRCIFIRTLRDALYCQVVSLRFVISYFSVSLLFAAGSGYLAVYVLRTVLFVRCLYTVAKKYRAAGRCLLSMYIAVSFDVSSDLPVNSYLLTLPLGTNTVITWRVLDTAHYLHRRDLCSRHTHTMWQPTVPPDPKKLDTQIIVEIISKIAIILNT